MQNQLRQTLSNHTNQQAKASRNYKEVEMVRVKARRTTREVPPALAFPLAVCMDAIGYHHLINIDQAEEDDSVLCTQSSSGFGDNASVAHTRSGISYTSYDQHSAILMGAHSVTVDETNHHIPHNSSQIDRIHGVLKNSTPLFESIRRGQWKLAMSFLQTGSVCCNVARDEEVAPRMVPPLELIRTWVSMYQTDGSLVWRRLPLHEALCRGAPAELVYMLLELYPLAAEAADSDGNLPLHLAMEHNAACDIVQIILQEYPKAMETTNNREQLPLECVITEATTGLASPMRGQVLQRYVNAAKQVAHQSVPKLKSELFQVNKTIEAAKSELRLAKLELGMIKEQQRLMAARKVKEESNMKEEVLRLRAELETLRCEREQLEAEKELWTEKCKQEQWVVAEVLSSDGNDAWIANEFNEMVNELERTSRLVQRKPHGHDSAVARESLPVGDVFPPGTSVWDAMQFFPTKSDDMMKTKKHDTELKECKTDTTEISDDAFTEQQFSSEEDKKPLPRNLSEGNEVKPTTTTTTTTTTTFRDPTDEQARKISQTLLSIMQQADDDGPFDSAELKTEAQKGNAIFPEPLEETTEKTKPDMEKRESTKPAADKIARDTPGANTDMKVDESRGLDAVENKRDDAELIAETNLAANQTDEGRIENSPGDEKVESDESIMGVKSSDSWEEYIKTNKPHDQTSRRKRFAALWKTNAMADDLTNIEIEAEDMEGDDELGSLVKARQRFAALWNSNAMADDLSNLDTEVEDMEDDDELGPLVKARFERRRPNKRKEVRKKKAFPEKPVNPRRETRDEDNSDGREKEAATKNGHVTFAREAVTIEETRESFSRPFNEFDDAVDKTLTKISRRTSSLKSSSRNHRRSHQSRSKSRPRSQSNRRDQNIYVTGEDKVEILTSGPQMSFESSRTSSSSKSIATSAEPYGRQQLSHQDSSSVAGYTSLA